MAAIIVYFSRRDENYVSGAIKNLTVGNTEVAANMIQKLTGAEIFKMQPVQEYSRDYNECIAQAQADQRRDARPELETYPESLDGYDTVYLGYPNYWGTMPMAVFTFLEHFDFSGKTILPFCTHEGSGMGRSESDIRRLCPDAKVKKGLALCGGSIRHSEPEIRRWLEEFSSVNMQ
ncbi:MAG: flavodoxin [Roseburia sp.]|nr:flavodoxin [Roseburia sp.]